MFPWRCLVGGERVKASVCSSSPPLCCFYTSPHHRLLLFYHAIHRLLPLFLIYFLKNKNISNIGKLYYKEGVAWMYVYMRNYVKIKKMIYQRKKMSKKKKYRKDNLRTWFVEIPSYKGAVDRAASSKLCPAKSDLNPSQPTAQTPSKPAHISTYLLP